MDIDLVVATINKRIERAADKKGLLRASNLGSRCVVLHTIKGDVVLDVRENAKQIVLRTENKQIEIYIDITEFEDTAH